MKEIGKRIWNEPAVAIGLGVSLILLIGGIIDGHMDWDANHIIAVLAPLLTALGIRQTVIPTAKLEEITAPPPAGTTYAGKTGYGVKK